jgi:putative membrane protein
MLAIFASGAATGLLVFTRFLNHLLQKHGDATMSFMLGLVIGSLYAIWPFKSFGMVAGRRVDIANIIPANFTMNEALTVLACVVGMFIVIVFMEIEKRQKAPARCSDTA